MSSTSPVLFWFRQDLRLDDNPALRAAIDTGQPVVPVFVLDDVTPGDMAYGSASRWWLHKSLDSLGEQLKSAGSTLVLRRGDAKEIIPKLVQEIGASQVFWNRRYAKWQVEADKALKKSLEDDEIRVTSCNGRLLYEPWDIETKSGGPYRVFTPFWKALKSQGNVRDTVTAIRKIDGPSRYPATDTLSDWALLPTKPNWAKGFEEVWEPGEKGAMSALRNFLDGPVDSYKDDRNRPDRNGTSRLSPHLHFGEISPVQIWHLVRNKISAGEVPDSQGDVFLSEIAWREFSYSLIYFNPEMHKKELMEKFRDFPWEHSEKKLEAWKKGQTGYPIVDAGMRQLWREGWMHNRIRMVVGSFLVKHLLLDWRDGMMWFWDTLVDADEANNTASWQWIAGCGADAAPYFRIFNPMTQGERFDPDGDYVRKYVEELRDLPAKHIHTPWDAPKDVLKKAGVELGRTYPEPMVDHKQARQNALDAYQSIK
ncbi:cryptochrome/photolyase family protein [Aquisalinus flavus]|uniref:Deoxyribodipyrimidine photo-lyase n=1 Tax=Aquisalinus flavus TaxID=1526572 RepID=A0A8J2Y6H9_9PROT|nr:deoxyribodipyrimidine photo-lyase [Aquisalinus flavus]MBD0427726.1 deoxyribodipyrimidine photo-lyase [Aquisalinus flavus]UNE47504.1 deoxyribodipyrimidine photo-lyase [Aquisalinus flavus]GGD03321.1 deoxyribodipyrimidine photo-lyase [Aquisalinus flavus]